MPQDTKRRYLNEKEVSDLTGIAVSTLRNHRHLRKGLPYICHEENGRIIYDMVDIEEYMASRKIHFNLKKKGKYDG